MLWPTMFMGLLAACFLVIALRQGSEVTEHGLMFAWKTTISILPMLIFVFIIAGFVNVLVPKDAIATWVGESSGIKGILIGAVAGGLTPGGPYTSLPLAAGLYKAGASIGTMVAYLTGWSLWAVARIPLEIGVLGWRLTVIRIISTLIFPVIAGFIANGVAKLIH